MESGCLSIRGAISIRQQQMRHVCVFVDGELHACCPRWLRVTHSRQIGQHRCTCEDERDVSGLHWTRVGLADLMLSQSGGFYLCFLCLTMRACHLPTPNLILLYFFNCLFFFFCICIFWLSFGRKRKQKTPDLNLLCPGEHQSFKTHAADYHTTVLTFSFVS